MRSLIEQILHESCPRPTTPRIASALPVASPRDAARSPRPQGMLRNLLVCRCFLSQRDAAQSPCLLVSLSRRSHSRPPPPHILNRLEDTPSRLRRLIACQRQGNGKQRSKVVQKRGARVSRQPA